MEKELKEKYVACCFKHCMYQDPLTGAWYEPGGEYVQDLCDTPNLYNKDGYNSFKDIGGCPHCQSEEKK